MAKSQAKEFSKPARNASDTSGQAGGACKILPFRQARSGKSPGIYEPDQSLLAVVPDEQSPLAQRRGFLGACLPECSNMVSCHQRECPAGEPTGSTSSLSPRWLKRVLLMSVFAAWTAAAIALSIALG